MNDLLHRYLILGPFTYNLPPVSGFYIFSAFHFCFDFCKTPGFKVLFSIKIISKENLC